MSISDQTDATSSAGSGLPIGANDREIKAWIEALPLFDAEKALQQILLVLTEINRADLKNGLRYRTLRLLQSALCDPLAMVRKRYLAAPLPLTGKSRESALLARELLHEMATGYSICISQLATTGNRRLSKKEVVLSVYYSMTCLGELILERYLCYEQLAPGTWRQLNTLYKSAQAHNLATLPVQTDKGRKNSSVERAYIQSLLLAAINPYRLLRGKTAEVYRQMEEWSHHCVLVQPAREWQPAGELIMQLTDDQPPHHTTPEEQFEHLSEIRIMNIDQLQAVIQERLEAHENSAGKGATSPLPQHRQKSLLSQLTGDWKSKNRRTGRRIRCTKGLELVIGFRDCHFILGGEHFESDQKDEAAPLSELQLIPAEAETGTFHAPIQVEEPAGRGLEQHSLCPSETDQDPVVSKYFPTQTNLSGDGISIHFEFISGLRPRIGDLVCYRTEKDILSDWKLGVIRWIELADDNGDFGVQILSSDTLPVFVQASEESDRGERRFQGLLISTEKDGHPDVCLITLATLYDVGAVLSIQMPSRNMQVRLTAVRAHGESFTCFSFRPETAS